MQRRDWLIVGGVVLLVALALLLPNLVLSRGTPAAPATTGSAQVDASFPTAITPAQADADGASANPTPTFTLTSDAEAVAAETSDPETSGLLSDTDDFVEAGNNTADNISSSDNPIENAINASEGDSGGDVGDYAVYSDPNGRFEIRYPDAWLLVGNEDVSPGNVNFVDISVESPEAWAYVNVAYAPVPNLADFVSAMQQSFARQPNIANFRVRGEQSTTINGLPAVEQTIRFDMDDIAVAQRTLYIQSTDLAFVLSLIVPEPSLDPYQLTFERMVASFTPTDLAE